ncbi:MAG TPA: glycosyltransferase family 9 protein [Coleofasciculaceae cyanobacterium]|jgi:ADP-heptose:LPS heptosyltransferase
MRIVALVPGGIGDQVLFFPTLDDLRKTYPDAEIDVVVEPKAKAAYRVCKSVDDVLLFDYSDRNSPADWANLLGVMRDRYYTVAIYSGQGWGVELLMWLTGIPTRVGFSSSAGKRFLTDVVADKAEQYPAHRYHDLLQGINVATAAPDLTIGIPKGDLDWAEGEQKRLGIKGSGYVLLHDGAHEAYPIDRWKTIVQSFRQQQPNLPIVIAASSQNPALTTALTADYPELKVTAPGDFGKLAAMIAGANLMLCTESAPMHLAVALQVYTLALLNSASLMPQTDKFAAIPSATGKLADIPPEQVLAKVWGG